VWQFRCSSSHVGLSYSSTSIILLKSKVVLCACAIVLRQDFLGGSDLIEYLVWHCSNALNVTAVDCLMIPKPRRKSFETAQ
jgi:hypothetical protein